MENSQYALDLKEFKELRCVHLHSVVVTLLKKINNLEILRKNSLLHNIFRALNRFDGIKNKSR